MNFSIAIMFLIGGLSQVHSHGTEVRTCLTTTGMRIFVEHWHGGTTAPNAGTMTIRADHEYGTPETMLYANGHIHGTAPGSLPGCRSGETDTLVTTCSETHNNWVYYDFPITCAVPVDYTLLSGQTVVLQEGCSQLYPARIQGIFACPPPTEAPSNVSSEEPSNVPTRAPTEAPTSPPTPEPTPAPSNEPTNVPSKEPSNVPTRAPTEVPTSPPTPEPTPAPSNAPTNVPSEEPSNVPTRAPTEAPTSPPTPEPTPEPTPAPSNAPTNVPSKEPSDVPSSIPSNWHYDHVNLGTAGNFAILTKSGVTTTGMTSVIGHMGTSPIAETALTGFALELAVGGTHSTSSMVTGFVYAADHGLLTPAMMTNAVYDMEAAYVDAAGRVGPGLEVEVGAGILSGMTLGAGIYKWSTNVNFSTYLTFEGTSTDVWIMQIAGTFTVGPGAEILLAGEAKAENIYWAIAGVVAFDDGSHGEGIFLAKTMISFNAGSSLYGAAFAQTAVTMISTSITGALVPSPFMSIEESED